jgi:hypothetical protein
MHGHGSAGALWSAFRRLAFALGVSVSTAGVSHADLMVTVDVKGDTAIFGTDASHLFGSGPFVSMDTGAFPYEAKFTFDLSQVNGFILPNLASATGLMDATFTALGQTFSIYDPEGSLTLSSAPGDNLYGQKISDGIASLDVAAIPKPPETPPASANPITTAALAQTFNFAGTPFSFSSLNGSLTRTIFTEGDTNILANVTSVAYSAGTSCPSIVSDGLRTNLSGLQALSSRLVSVRLSRQILVLRSPRPLRHAATPLSTGSR